MAEHKHAAVLRAIADGKDVQVFREAYGDWIDFNPKTHVNPISSGLSSQWRIKPEPKPDVHIYAAALRIGNNTSLGFRDGGEIGANLRLTFDGETGQLKAAEVLK